jgi:hypothetical protein
MHSCPRCEYASPSAWNFKRHLKTHERPCEDVGSEVGKSCKYCCRAFDRAYNCKRHEISCKHRPEHESEEPGQNVTLEGQFVTPEGQFVTSEGQFVTEDGEDENGGDIACPLCYKSFACKKTLQRHKNVCNGLKHPLMCPKCNLITKDRTAKHRHMQSCNGTVVTLPTLDATTPPPLVPAPSVGGPLIQGATVNIIVNGSLNYNNTINNNTQINCFGNEDMAHVMLPEYLDNRLLEFNGKGVYQMVKDIHFNKEIPQNRNVMMGSKKRKTLRLREGDGWHIRANDDVLDMLIGKYKRILQRRSCEADFQKSLKHESDFLQIQQDLIRFDKKNNPTAYYACAHKILALIEDLETDLSHLHG